MVGINIIAIRLTGTFRESGSQNLGKDSNYIMHNDFHILGYHYPLLMN